MENWKSIPGYEEFYEMTSTGRIRSLNYYGRKGNFHERKLGFNSNGYLSLNLSKEGKRKHFSIHVLLAMTFLEHDPNRYNFVVDHIDNDKLNNSLENLQVITQRENSTKDIKRKLPTGVKYDSRSSKNPYQSLIRIKGKVTRLGSFPTPEEASKAYQKALLNLAPEKA